MRGDHLDAERGELEVERVGVERLVAYEPAGEPAGETLRKSLADKGDLMRRSRRSVDGERKTMKVCHSHELRAFTPFGGAHSAPPLFRHHEGAVDEAPREVKVLNWLDEVLGPL